MDDLKTRHSVANFCFNFGEAYLAMHERGLISAEQMDRIVSLLDKIEDYPHDLFLERIEAIFNIDPVSKPTDQIIEIEKEDLGKIIIDNSFSFDDEF